jgi:hypothetical protein
VERDYVSPYWLAQQKGKDGFIGEAIDTLVAAAKKRTNGSIPGQDQSTLPPGIRDLNSRHKTIRYLEAWVRVPKKIADDFEKELLAKMMTDNPESAIPSIIPDPAPSLDMNTDAEEVEIMCGVGDNEVVRYMRSDVELRPYCRTVWEDIVDENSGRGVSDNVENIQLTLNGLFRLMEDGLSLTASPILAVKREFLDTKVKAIIPGMVLDIASECDDARKAFSQVVLTDVSSQCLNLIPKCDQYAEEDSMLPRITQGMESDKTMTAYETAQQLEKATKYISTVIRNFDESWIEPVIDWCYRYNMMDPKIQKGKGAYKIQALGFASFQDKVVRVQQLRGALMLALSNPVLTYNTEIRELLQELYRRSDIDPDVYMKSVQRLEEESAKQQADPMMLATLQKLAAEIEKLRADATAKIAQAEVNSGKLQIDQAKTLKELKRGTGTTVPGIPPLVPSQAVPKVPEPQPVESGDAAQYLEPVQ